MRRVYFDNNATTPVLPEVFEAMRSYFGERFGNASSIHHHGQETRAAVERARESVAGLLGARASEIVFTSGGTEADNLAVFGIAGTASRSRLTADGNRRETANGSQVTGDGNPIAPAGIVRDGDHIITSTIEHHAVLNACRHLEERGCEVTYVPVDGRGVVGPDDVRRALRGNTKLISIMFANNETGVVQPVAEIGKIAAEADIYFHADAVQAAGKIPVRVDEIGCDLLTISGHKLHAPQGVGALFVRKGTELEPVQYGGQHERSRRAGTENVAAIVGLGKAAELAMAGLERGDDKRMAELRDRLERELLELDCVGLNGNGARRVPNTTNIYFDGIEGEALVIALDLKGLAVSTGAACSSGAIEPSHVLLAMGLKPERARASIRFSLGKQNTAEDVEFAVRLVRETVARLRGLSPVWKGAASFEPRAASNLPHGG